MAAAAAPARTKLKPRAPAAQNPAYNPLTDPALSTFLSNPRVQRHLLSSGLIDAHGRIIPDDAVKAANALKTAERAMAEEDSLAREEAEIRVRACVRVGRRARGAVGCPRCWCSMCSGMPGGRCVA